MTRILRVVSIGSATGIYGGPFDTANRQCAVASQLGLSTVLIAGNFEGDRPRQETPNYTSVFVPVHRLSRVQGFSLVFSRKMLFEMWRQVRMADTVHISYSRELIPLVASVMALTLSKKIVLQPHGMLTSSTSFAHRMIDIIVRTIYSRASIILALTDVELADLKSWAPKFRGKYVVLGNPVPGELAISPRSPSSPPRVLFVARLHRRKRVDVFIQAARQLESNSSARFSVVGPDGGDLHLVRHAEASLSNFDYLGSVPSNEVVQHVGSADIFVLTSNKEPWGNVLATALNLGVPVVLSSSAALAGAVSRFGAGLVVEDGSSQDLAEAIERLTSNLEFYKDCSINAIRLSKQIFSPSLQIATLKHVYTF